MLGLKEGGTVSIRLDGSRVVIQPRSEEIEKRIDEWMNLMTRTKNEAFGEETTESWKWISHDHAKKKLGLH
jgi:virulence-associated protein VagC